MLPRVLKGFAVYVDGRGYIGRVETCKLPDLNVQTDEYRGSGMDAAVDLDMGMEKLDGTFTLADYDPEVIKLFGLFSANTQIVLRGAIQRQGEQAVAVEVRMQGGVKSLSRGDWQQGQRSSIDVGYNANRYSEKIAGETVVDIDIINMKRVIGGVDQLQSMRSALGA